MSLYLLTLQEAPHLPAKQCHSSGKTIIASYAVMRALFKPIKTKYGRETTVPRTPKCCCFQPRSPWQCKQWSIFSAGADSPSVSTVKSGMQGLNCSLRKADHKILNESYDKEKLFNLLSVQPLLSVSLMGMST